MKPPSTRDAERAKRKHHRELKRAVRSQLNHFRLMKMHADLAQKGYDARVADLMKFEVQYPELVR